MPLLLPVLDDRNFEQLLQEAKRRIPVHNPEWTNHEVESDPGITIIELFAFLTESLLYRANRIPELNRLKFLQLLGIPLQQAAAAKGIIVIRNERAPVAPLVLPSGLIVTAGNVNFLTNDPVNVLPVEAQIYFKKKIARNDPRYAEFETKYKAVKAAAVAAMETAQASGSSSAVPASTVVSSATNGTQTAGASVELSFYETTIMAAPTPSTPHPAVDMASPDVIGNALYIALLAPKNVSPEDVRVAIANQTLSIGIVPALADGVAPLLPQRAARQQQVLANLIYEIADASGSTTTFARFERLRVIQQPDVLNEVGIVQLELPEKEKLTLWEFTEPLQEGTGEFPPRIEDEKIKERLVTWIRLRLSAPQTSAASGPIASNANTSSTDGDVTTQPLVLTDGAQASTLNARLSWLGANAVRVTQAVPVFNELLGVANGEPDQVVTLANTPVIENSVTLSVEGIDGDWQLWRQVDDLLAAAETDEVFTIDHESGQIRFGTGLNGARPVAGRRIRASYLYGGGIQGNVGIGAIKASSDVRLQGGYKIENPIPTWGGDLGETVAEGERRIPLYLRHQDRLVAAQDFIDITQRTPGVDVGRVEVLPLFNPNQPQVVAAGVVTVMVIPQFDPVRPRWPTPHRLFLRAVCDYLDKRRLVTTEVYVRGPIYVPVFVSVGVEIRAGHFRDQVIQAVTARLEEYLSALAPGGPDETGWPLGKRLLKRDLEAVITRVAGVEFVASLELGVGSPLDVESRTLAGLQLPRLDLLSVRQGEAEPLSSIITAPVGPTIEPTIVPVPVTKSKC
jgi:Baseplate J-like protein